MSYSALAYTSVPSTIKSWVNQRIRWNIGGLQTLKKYRKFIFRGENLFGYFVITYVSLSFVLSLLGIFLLLRFIYYALFPYIPVIPYIFKGYNPLVYFSVPIYFSVLLMLGLTFLTLSFIYHRIALNKSDLKNKGIMTIFKYTFLYRPLYMIPLVISLYKMSRKDIGWYTK